MELEYMRQTTRRQDVANERAYTEKKQAEERQRILGGPVGKAYGTETVAEANVMQDREQAEQRITAGKEAVESLETYKKAILTDMEKNGATVAEIELVRVADKDSDMRMAYAQFASRKNQEASREATGERFDETRAPKPWDVFRQASTQWFDLRPEERRQLNTEAAKVGKTGMQMFIQQNKQNWEQFQMQQAAQGSVLQPQAKPAAAPETIQPQVTQGETGGTAQIAPQFTQAVQVLNVIAATGTPEEKKKAQHELDRLRKEGFIK